MRFLDLRCPAMRFVRGAAAAAMATLLLSGCGSLAVRSTATPTITVAPSGSSPTPTPTPPPARTPVPSATATTTGNPEPTTSAAAIDPNRPANQCPDDVIGVAIAPQGDGGAAGNTFSTIYFTNTGGATCVLRGAAGVSVVGNGNGTQLGEPAKRFQTGVTTVRLASGATAVATLTIVHVGTDGGPLDGCTVRKGDGYRIYPPHSMKSFFVEDPEAVACAPGPVFMTVSPVERQPG